MLKSIGENAGDGGPVENVKTARVVKNGAAEDSVKSVNVANSAATLAEKLYAGIYRGKVLVVFGK